MEQQDLTKKLEAIKIPTIRIQAHKQRLKFALLNSEHFQKRTDFSYVRRFFPIGAIAVFALIFGSITVKNNITEAKAMNIAKNDPKIQQMMKDRGAVISDVKIKGGKAYVLLSLSKDNAPFLMGNASSTVGQTDSDEIGIVENEDGEPESLNSSVAEIDLDDEHVDNIRSHKTPIPALSRDEKAQAIEIIKSNDQVKSFNINFEEAEIRVKPLPPFQLHIGRENKGEHSGITIAGSAEDKRAIVDIEFNSSEHKIVVNLTQKKVEQIINELESEEDQNDDQTATGTDSPENNSNDNRKNNHDDNDE